MSTLASFFYIIRFAKSSWGLVVSYEKKKKKKTIRCGRFSSFFAIFKRVIFQGLNDIIASLKRETKQ